MKQMVKRFIVLTDKDLEKIKSGKVVTCEDCYFFEHEPPFDIFCVSEESPRFYRSA